MIHDSKGRQWPDDGTEIVWPENESRIETIGANGNTGEHYDAHYDALMSAALERSNLQERDRLHRMTVELESMNAPMSSPAAGNDVGAIDEGAHYRYSYKGFNLDPFRICSIYGITDFGQQTLVKKSLRLGTAHKDRLQDLKDCRCCIDRMIEMMEEDS